MKATNNIRRRAAEAFGWTGFALLLLAFSGIFLVPGVTLRFDLAFLFVPLILLSWIGFSMSALLFERQLLWAGISTFPPALWALMCWADWRFIGGPDVDPYSFYPWRAMFGFAVLCSVPALTGIVSVILTAHSYRSYPGPQMAGGGAFRRGFVATMSVETSLFDSPDAEARSEARAEADVEAGRVISHEAVRRWLSSWGSVKRLPRPHHN